MGAGLSLALLLAGCVIGPGHRYVYGGVDYPTRSAAVYAIMEAVDDGLEGLPPADPRLGGTALVVIPPREALLARDLSESGDLTGETRDYLRDARETIALGMAEAARAAKVFDRLEITRRDDLPATGYDYRLRYGLSGAGRWEWTLARTGVEGEEPVRPEIAVPGRAGFPAFNAAIVRAAGARR